MIPCTRSVSRAIAAVWLLGAMACAGSDSLTPLSTGVAGTWALATYDGAPLPAMILVIGGTSYNVNGGGMTVNSNGTFTRTETSSPAGESGAASSNGNWVAATAANTYTFTVGNTTLTVVVAANTLTLTQVGDAARTYTRQ